MMWKCNWRGGGQFDGNIGRRNDRLEFRAGWGWEEAVKKYISDGVATRIWELKRNETGSLSSQSFGYCLRVAERL
jgi:hypothetical protein